MNLRLTVQYEITTGYRMNYLTDTFFPPLTPTRKSSHNDLHIGSRCATKESLETSGLSFLF